MEGCDLHWRVVGIETGIVYKFIEINIIGGRWRVWMCLNVEQIQEKSVNI
jgi:hypothetical protein